MGRTLSIIIPARDAEREIAKTLEDYVAYFREVYSQDFEILVVPNDCSDNTVSIVEEYCNRYPVIRSQVYEGSIGKGGAVIEGFKLAQGDILSFVDADGATGPAELFKLVQALGEHQAVIGSRWMPGSKVLVKQGFARRIPSAGPRCSPSGQSMRLWASWRPPNLPLMSNFYTGLKRGDTASQRYP
jgi:glycosyltransferase involved in cell wall biosynthesis